MHHLPIEGYVEYVVAPESLPALRCRFLKPRDFRVSPLPIEEHDFSRRTAFLPLVVTLTPRGPLVFSVAARPAQPDGRVSHWLEQLCRNQGFVRGPIAPSRLGASPAVTCDAIQKGYGVVMKMRLLLMEDGGRLFQINAMAPEALWPAAEKRFLPMLESFQLAEVHGPTVPLLPDRIW
jgi:hypothetical protein